MWEEFATEVESILGSPAGDDSIYGFINNSINLLDSMFWSITSDDMRRENCLHIAANVYKLYQLYKGGEGCDANTVTAEPSTS